MNFAASSSTRIVKVSTKALRIIALSVVAATLTAKAFAGAFCNPVTFVPAYQACPVGTQYYATCSCTGWNFLTGYTGCSVVDGCY